MSCSAVVCGVTGQPVYWMARVLAHVMFNRGLQVYMSGSPESRAGKGVMAHVRWGRGPMSAVVPRGDCQAVLGLEPLESVRCALRYFTPGMHVVSSNAVLKPAGVVFGKEEMPDVNGMFQRLRNSEVHIQIVHNDNPNAGEEMAAFMLTQARIHGKALVEPHELAAALRELKERQAELPRLHN